MVKGILIDPFKQTVEWHEYEGLDGIYAALGAQPMDTVVMPNGHAMYIDDEGLYREDQKFWQFPDFVRPIAGRGLIVRITDSGDDADCKYHIDRIRSAVVWRPEIEFDGFSEPEPDRTDASGMVHIHMGEAKFRPKTEEGK